MEVPLGDTYYFLFTTRQFSTGAPFTLAGTPVLSVYEENNLTQITSGVAVSADYDSVTGLNECSVVATTGNGYEAGKYYSVVVTTGTVDSVSVVGEVVGHFRVMPAEDAGAGIKDVNCTHVADTAQTANDNGLDINALITTIGTAGDGLTAINLPDQTMDITGNITGNLSGSVGSVTGAVGSVTGAVASVTGNVGGSVASVTGAVGSVTGAVGSVAGNVDGNVTGSVGSNIELGPAEVNAEVLDVMNTDTFAEPGLGAPGATISIFAKINYLYKAWRNQHTQTSSTYSLYNDAADTVDQQATVSDNGTTATKGEIGSG